MASPCCGAPLVVDGWGHVCCVQCWGTVSPKQIKHVPARDLIAWCFPPAEGPRPTGEPIFLRYGKRIELSTSAIRGKPDSWSWTGA